MQKLYIRTDSVCIQYLDIPELSQVSKGYLMDHMGLDY
jgi:hypothetical protein